MTTNLCAWIEETMEHGPIPPNGIEHLKFLTERGEVVRAETAGHFEQNNVEMDLIGTSLNVLYQAATCHRGCRGGGHHLERLCGRAYNLGQAAWQLTAIGLYDEALNLVRGIGEISNLIGMSAIDKQSIQEWLSSDKKTRLSKFSPNKVRQILKAKAPLLMAADDDWYGDLSESYTHPTPETRPGYHGERIIVGGIY